MTESLAMLLRELEEFGLKNDAIVLERPGRMLNITRDTGRFLSVLVRATNAGDDAICKFRSNHSGH